MTLIFFLKSRVFQVTPVTQYLEIIRASRLHLELTADDQTQLRAIEHELTILGDTFPDLRAKPIIEAFEAKHAPVMRGFRQRLALEAKTNNTQRAGTLFSKVAEPLSLVRRAAKRRFNFNSGGR